MSPPEYMYAKPRLEHIVKPEDARKQADAWTWLPNSLYEWSAVVLTTGCAAAMNVRLAGRPVPLYRGILKFPIAYALGLYGARWADKSSYKSHVKEDKIIEEYVRLHPERFQRYQPKKLIETFGPWVPIRSGGGNMRMRQDEEVKVWKKKETDHYVPLADEKF